MDSMKLAIKNAEKPSGFIKFVLPSVLSMVFMALYTVIDGIFVSRYSGPDALAAINIVLPLFSLAGGLGIMAASGGSAIVGIHLGAGERKEANRLFSMVVSSTTLMGCLLSILAFIGFEPLLHILGASERLMPYAKIYGLMIVLALPVFILKVLLEFFMRIDGKPNLSLIMSISGGVINIVLDWLFMAVFHMGIAGAAIATAIGAVVSLGIGIWYFFTQSTLKFSWVKWDFKHLSGVAFNGSSEMLTELSTGITTFLFNLTALKLAGETGLAALSILLYTHFLLMSAFLGFSSGVAPLISYAHGANDHAVMKKIIARSRKYILVASIIITLFTVVKADLLTRIFISSNSPVYALTFVAIQLFAPTFIFMGINIFSSAKYTALNNGKVSAQIALLRSLIGTLLGLAFLPSLLGLEGLWLVIPFSEMLTFGLVVYLNKQKKSATVLSS